MMMLYRLCPLLLVACTGTRALSVSTLGLNTSKLPRLFVQGLHRGQLSVEMSPDHAHYVRNVMRLRQGDRLRVFNSDCGEYLAAVDIGSRRGGRFELIQQLRDVDGATSQHLPCRLLFAPIKKTRVKVLLEKATELGVLELLPVVTQNTQFIIEDPEQYQSNLIQSAEQCERMSIPVLHKPTSISSLIQTRRQSGTTALPLLVCAERLQSGVGSRSLLKEVNRILAPTIGANPAIGSPVFDILVGPEGGFTGEELSSFAALPNVSLVSLGPNILRAETASICALSTIVCAVDALRQDPDN